MENCSCSTEHRVSLERAVGARDWQPGSGGKATKASLMGDYSMAVGRKLASIDSDHGVRMFAVWGWTSIAMLLDQADSGSARKNVNRRWRK